MKFDFDEMAELYQRSPEMFEQRRNELINDVISKCSQPQQKALRKLQSELDEVRKKQPDIFMQVLFDELVKSARELNATWRRLDEINIQ